MRLQFPDPRRAGSTCSWSVENPTRPTGGRSGSRTPEVERYLRSLDDSTRGAVLRDLEGTLRGLYSQILSTFGL